MYTVKYTASGRVTGMIETPNLREAWHMCEAGEKEHYEVSLWLDGKQIYPVVHAKAEWTRAHYEKSLNEFDGSEGR